MDSKDELFWPIIIVCLLALLVFGTYAATRNWAECRAVPHTVFYCLTN